MTAPAAAQLRRLATLPESDRHLLAAFKAERSEAAFAELVRRHAGLVFGVCRRVLGHTQDAEDAFQATFLVLARKAASVSRTETISPWLYAVAVRTARELRHMRDRRRQRELNASERNHTSASLGSPDPDLAAVLDEELARLPEHFRLPIVLCELKGRPRRMVAAELGIPEGTLSSRLAAAKKRLAERLARRGVNVGVATLAAVLAQEATAYVPAALLTTTARVATDAAGGAVTLATAAAIGAADSVVKAMLVTKLKGLAVVLGVAAVGFGGVALVPSAAGSRSVAAAAPADDPAALVKQLGSPQFAEREAAEKQLRAMGLPAKPALLAGAASADREVAARSLAMLTTIRKQQMWDRFAKIVGDNKASRELFDLIRARPKVVERLDAAEDDPKKAGELYLAWRDELNAVSKVAGWPRNDGTDVRGGWHAPPAESAAWLFLGTYPGTDTTGPGEKLKFMPYTHDVMRKPPYEAWHGALAYGPHAAPLHKLIVGWLDRRRDYESVRYGLALVHELDLTDGLSAARWVLGQPASNRDLELHAIALALIGQMGTKDDLPLVLRWTADATVVSVLINDPTQAQKTDIEVTFIHPTATEGRDRFCQFRDIAVPAAARLAGRKAEEWGYDPWPSFLYPSGGKVDVTGLSTKYGFTTTAARNTALAKAKPWLDEQRKSHAEKPDPESEKLVKQLGSAVFAEREAAEKKLRAMGLKAKAAVRAGAKDSDPEVVKRSADVLDAIRREQFWPRFAKLIGDDADAKALFDAIRSVPRNVELIEAAEEKTEAVSKLYADRRTELNERCTDRSDPKRLVFMPTRVSASELAGFLYLGTFPGAEDEGYAQNVFLPSWRYNWIDSRLPFSATLVEGPLKVGTRRLVVKWVETRTSSRELECGFNGAMALGLSDVVPFAKEYIRKAVAVRPKYAPEPVGLALVTVGKLGSKEDLLFLLGYADDVSVVHRVYMMSLEDEKNPPREFRPGKDVTTEVRDVAVVAALVLCGQSREKIDEYGFFISRYDPQTSGKPLPPVGKRRWADDPLTIGDLGFIRDEDREAAHKKARAWLALQVKPDPEAEKLVKQLGSAVFAEREAAEKKLREMGLKAKGAVLAGLRSADPEVVKRCEAIRVHFRREEHWPRFAKLIGDDKPARDLYAKIMSQNRSAELIEAVSENPAKAAEHYFKRLDELNAQVPNPWSSVKEYVDLADVLGWLYLGTFADSGGTRQLSRTIRFQGSHVQWVDTSLTKLLDKSADPLATPIRKLFSRWMIERRDDDGQILGLGLALEYDLPGAVDAARTFLKLPGKDAQYVPNRGKALLVLVTHGTADDIPLLKTFADDTTACFTLWAVDPAQAPPAPAGRGRGLREVPPGGPTTQYRDIAVAAMLRIRGQNAQEFGWFARAKGVADAVMAVKGRGTIPKQAGYTADRIMFDSHAFNTDKERDAAHAKANAWLEKNGPAEPKSDPKVKKLVQQLGAPAFADREAAEKELLAMPAIAMPAVKAGLSDADPEIVARSKALLPRLMSAALAASDHPVWVRFKKVVGDDGDSRKLFLDMIADGRRAELLDKAEGDLPKAGEVYSAELKRMVLAVKQGYQQAEFRNRAFTGINLPDSGYPTRGEFGTLLFLGTYPATAKETYKHAGESNGVSHHNMFGFGLVRPGAGPRQTITPEIRRVFAAWLAIRADADIAAQGLWLATHHDMKESLPAARTAAANAKLDPKARGYAMLAVGHLGAKADLPILNAALADERVFHSTRYTDGKGGEKPVVVQVRDAALAATLHLHGQALAGYGFPLIPMYKADGPDVLKNYYMVGFFDAAGRDAAHAKAKAWLADQPKPAEKKEPAKPDPEVEKLVKQLGSPQFAEREDAEKKLKALGVKAKAAVKAGMADPDPEVAARSAAIWNAIRRDQLWPAFAAAAGGDPQARELFDKMMASPRATDAAEAALDNPTQADELYRTRTAELLRLAAGHSAVDADGAPSKPADRVTYGTPVPLGDVVGWLFLGTRQPGSGEWSKVTYDRWGSVGSREFPFLPEEDLKSAKPTQDAFASASGAALKKLTAAWLLRRREIDGLQVGLTVAVRFDIPEAIGLARAVLRGQPPAAEGLSTRAVAIVLVGRHGTAADLPLLARFTTDEQIHLSIGAPPGERGARLTCQIRDAAVVSMCQLAGKNPAEFGFPPFPSSGKVGNMLLGPGPISIGFTTDAHRVAAFANAAAWIKSIEQQVDPEAVKLVKQLGAPAFADREAAEKKLLAMPKAAVAAVRAGMVDADPEIAARCKALLPKVMAAALSAADHPVWARFQKFVGDDAASRKLFMDMVVDGRRAELLDRAEADPAKAGDVYAAELSRMVIELRTGFAEAEVAARGFSGTLTPTRGIPTRGEFATLLFLGTYPATAKITFKQANDHDRFAHHGVFGFGLAGPGDRANPPPTPPEVRKLFAAWLLNRADPGILEHGLALANYSDMKEVLPAARAAAANADLAPGARGFAMLVIGQLGVKADMTLLEQALTDDRVFQSTYSNRRPINTQVKDAALAAILHRHGQDPAEYGYSMLAEYRLKRDPDVLKKYHLLGFYDEDARKVTHTRAMAWLAEQANPTAKPATPPVTFDAAHPAWPRFKELTGDDAISRTLFAELTADPHRAKVFAAVAADPKTAQSAYRAEAARALADREQRTKRPAIGVRTPTFQPPDREFTQMDRALLMVLGSYPGTGVIDKDYPVVREQDVAAEIGAAFNRMFTAHRPHFTRLYARWFDHREDDTVLFKGFRRFGAPLLPTARRLIADKDRSAKTRAAAAIVVGTSGSKDDLPALATLHNETTEVQTWKYKDEAYTVTLADVSLGVSVWLAGGDPGELGFEYLAKTFQGLKRGPNGEPQPKVSSQLVGLWEGLFAFLDAKARTATHAKAKAWLAERK